MKKILRTALIAVSTVSLIALVAPAQALTADAPAKAARNGGAVAVTATTTIVVPEDACITHPFNYSLTLPDPSKRWQLDLYAYRADGTLRGSATAGTYQGSTSPTGTVDMQFCGLSWEPGPVTVHTEFDYRDAGDVFYTVAGPTLNLNIVREVTSAVALKAKTKGNKVVAKAAVNISTGASTYPVDGATVTLQKKVGKKWKAIATKTATVTGTVKFAFKAKGKHKTQIRAYFSGLGEFTAVGTGVPIPAATSKVAKVG